MTRMGRPTLQSSGERCRSDYCAGVVRTVVAPTQIDEDESVSEWILGDRNVADWYLAWRRDDHTARGSNGFAGSDRVMNQPVDFTR